MSSKPLVSVCIPCYNGARFIGRTIESVLQQTLTDLEVVLVDDLSTDATLEIIKTFTDSRVRVLRNPVNLGMGGNWNRALSSGVGKYVKLLCEDDLLHPECLERQVSILEAEAHSKVDLAVCNRNVINSRDEVVLGPRHGLGSGIFAGRSLISKCLQLGSNIIGEPAVGLFRREALSREQICDPENPYLSDLSLWTEVLRHGDAFVDPEVLASFRISSGAATTGIGIRQAFYFRRFARGLRDDPFYQATRSDLVRAYMLSFLWCLIRNAFIRYQTARFSSGFETGQISTKALVPKQSHANCS
jgi:glycosyltransferase involved in cell wall biosynthesis